MTDRAAKSSHTLLSYHTTRLKLRYYKNQYLNFTLDGTETLTRGRNNTLQPHPTTRLKYKYVMKQYLYSPLE